MKFWYLWAKSHDGKTIHALGPFSTSEGVDKSERPFRKWADDHLKGWNFFCSTGGVCYDTDQGPGAANKYVLS